MKNKNRPICDNNMIYFERYPKMICHKCVELATTEDGESIQFYNVDHTGDFISVVNNVHGEIHDCLVNNKKCYADEARFGGIVVQLSE